MSPYKEKLKKMIGQEIIISRNGASNLRGKLQSIEYDGCYILVKGSNLLTAASAAVIIFFVAYEDICGVGEINWGYDVMQ